MKGSAGRFPTLPQGCMIRPALSHRPPWLDSDAVSRADFFVRPRKIRHQQFVNVNEIVWLES
jgi:hypothetical protein